MNRARSFALVCVATMLLPLLPLPAVEAATETVSFRPSVAYTAVKSDTTLYFAQVLGGTRPGQANPTASSILWTYPPVADDPVREESFAVVGATDTTETIPGVADFQMQEDLKSPITVTGKNPFE